MWRWGRGDGTRPATSNMNALLAIAALLFVLHASAEETSGNATSVKPENRTSVKPENSTSVEPDKVKLFDNVYMKIPEDGRGVSFQIDANDDTESGRGKKKKMLEKFMPMFVMPFVIQSTIIPMFLGMIKFLLFKSLMIGKLALVLIILNSFRNSNSFHGRNDADIASSHYGYAGHGMEVGSMLN